MLYIIILILYIIIGSPSVEGQWYPTPYGQQPYDTQPDRRDFTYKYRVPPRTYVPEDYYLLDKYNRPQPYSYWMNPYGQGSTPEWYERQQLERDRMYNFMWDGYLNPND